MKTKAGSKVSVMLSKFEHHHSQSASSRFRLIVILSAFLLYHFIFIIFQRTESDYAEIDTRSADVKSLLDRWEVGARTVHFIILTF